MLPPPHDLPQGPRFATQNSSGVYIHIYIYIPVFCGYTRSALKFSWSSPLFNLNLQRSTLKAAVVYLLAARLSAEYTIGL